MVEQHDFKEFPELSNAQIEEFGFQSPHKQITEDFRATVVKVVDGDTVTLSVGFRDFDFPLRMLDIDAPEMNEGGKEAKDWLIDRIEGEDVDIFMDEENRVDKWGRLLGRIFHRGMDVGEEEMIIGIAKPFDQRNEGKIPNINKTLDPKKWFPQ